MIRSLSFPLLSCGRCASLHHRPVYIRSQQHRRCPTLAALLLAPAHSVVSDPNVVCAAGTTRLLDMARQYSVQNFVYASSSSVYGCSDRQVLQEADAVEKPVSPYAATKKACEVSCSPHTLFFSLPVLPPPSAPHLSFSCLSCWPTPSTTCTG